MIVTEVLPVLTTIEGIELEAILSTPRSLDKAEALAKQYGLSQATSDYEAILSNPEVDTIYVGTPNHTHYDYAKKALLAGKHVICEKPFTLHLEEFEELAKLAQEKELLLMEAITNQYLANFTMLLKKIRGYYNSPSLIYILFFLINIVNTIWFSCRNTWIFSIYIT